MQDLQLRYFRINRDGSPQGELVATLTSSAVFQLQHPLRDLKLLLERSYPDLAPAVFPVQLEFESARPVLTLNLPNGGVVRRSYSPLALRGHELLWSRRPELLKDGHDIACVASLAPQVQPRRATTIELDAPSPPAELTVSIEQYPELDQRISLDDLWCVGACHSMPTDLPVVIERKLLEQLAQDEASQSGKFVERGYFLTGQLARNGPTGDLVVLVCNAIRAEQTVGTAGTLLWTPETKARLSNELERRAQSGQPERLVGWQHSHDLAALSEPKPDEQSETDERSDGPRSEPGSASATDADARLFSLFDIMMHKRDFAPSAVALVLDASAARKDRHHIPRCFAAFGTINGIAARRAFYVGSARSLRLKRAAGMPASSVIAASAESAPVKQTDGFQPVGKVKWNEDRKGGGHGTPGSRKRKPDRGRVTAQTQAEAPTPTEAQAPTEAQTRPAATPPAAGRA
jgi:hypothetical protein